MSRRPTNLEERRRILLYGHTLILDSLGAVVENWGEFELISLPTPLPGAAEVEALAPDAVFFDIETTHPEALFPLLETRPDLLLVGISPDGNVMRLWSGRQLRQVSGKEFKDVIEAELALRGPSSNA